MFLALGRFLGHIEVCDMLQPQNWCHLDALGLQNTSFKLFHCVEAMQYSLYQVTTVSFLPPLSPGTLIRSPVLRNTGETLIFNIPGSSRKGTVKVCVLLPDGTCHGDGNITYQSLPSCSDITPDRSWSR